MRKPPIKSSLLAGILLTFLSASAVSAQQVANGGRAAFDFLQISPISRAVGLGGAYTAIGDDIGAIYYNPGGLAGMLTSEMNITYQSLYQGINYEFIAFGYPLGESLPNIGGTLALSVGLLQPGSLPRTDDTGVTVNGTATFTSADQIFSLAYAHAIGPYVQLGVCVNYIYQQIDSSYDSLYDVNAGIVVLPPFDGMRVGLSLKNLGAQEAGFDLPFTLNGGLSYRRYELFSEQDDGAITAEVAFPIEPIENPVGVKVGLEYDYKWYGNRVTLRGGYEFLDTALDGVGLALGAGYGFDCGGASLFLDYAFAPEDIFGSAHRVSLTTKF